MEIWWGSSCTNRLFSSVCRMIQKIKKQFRSVSNKLQTSVRLPESFTGARETERVWIRRHLNFKYSDINNNIDNEKQSKEKAEFRSIFLLFQFNPQKAIIHQIFIIIAILKASLGNNAEEHRKKEQFKHFLIQFSLKLFFSLASSVFFPLLCMCCQVAAIKTGDFNWKSPLISLHVTWQFHRAICFSFHEGKFWWLGYQLF